MKGSTIQARWVLYGREAVPSLTCGGLCLAGGGGSYNDRHWIWLAGSNTTNPRVHDRAVRCKLGWEGPGRG